MRVGQYDQAAVTRIYIVQTGKNNEIVTIDPTVPTVITGALPSIGRPGAVEGAGVYGAARLVNQPGATHKAGFIVG